MLMMKKEVAEAEVMGTVESSTVSGTVRIAASTSSCSDSCSTTGRSRGSVSELLLVFDGSSDVAVAVAVDDLLDILAGADAAAAVGSISMIVVDSTMGLATMDISTSAVVLRFNNSLLVVTLAVMEGLAAVVAGIATCSMNRRLILLLSLLIILLLKLKNETFDIINDNCNVSMEVSMLEPFTIVVVVYTGIVAFS
jgi:hypothetical protein